MTSYSKCLQSLKFPKKSKLKLWGGTYWDVTGTRTVGSQTFKDWGMFGTNGTPTGEFQCDVPDGQGPEELAQP